MSLLLLIVLFCVLQITNSIDNGLGLTPPQGWRSWNAYHENISQQLMTKCIDALLDKSRNVNGTPTSLAELGYKELGVDDSWQLCDTTGHYFHNDTAPNGWANINTKKFPNVKDMINYAHKNGVNVGWYFNNCDCSEHEPYPGNTVNDVKFLRYYDFDAVKIDSCGSSENISNWEYYINITSPKPLLIEMCNTNYWNSTYGPNYCNQTWCPANFFRTCGDINPNYPAIIGNLGTTIKYQAYPTGFVSKPGSWAYPDMLEVGNIPQQQKASVHDMDQSHFSAWCIVSAPLILGFDLTNSSTMNRVWDVITNTEVLSISQSWAGHPGRRIASSEKSIRYNDMMQYKDSYNKLSLSSATISGYEIWAKPQPNNKYAVLLMNNDGQNSQDITVQFSGVPWSGSANIRDIVNKKDLGSFTTSYTSKNIPPFGSTFLLFS